jgi:hypothetical protein
MSNAVYTSQWKRLDAPVFDHFKTNSCLEGTTKENVKKAGRGCLALHSRSRRLGLVAPRTRSLREIVESAVDYGRIPCEC